jgi:UDP-N-acetylglucosamine 2-epimerase (non-hydrolysing)
VTGHRRESFGQGLVNIFQTLKRITRAFSETEIVYPVHLNPNVQKPAHAILGGEKRIHLIRPITYEETYWIMDRAFLILTDSGGIQEEAPSFQKPVLVLRNVTERPEGIHAGVAKLVGTDPQKIFCQTLILLTSPKAYRAMAAHHNPYGDGRSAERVIKILRRTL